MEEGSQRSSAWAGWQLPSIHPSVGLPAGNEQCDNATTRQTRLRRARRFIIRKTPWRCCGWSRMSDGNLRIEILRLESEIEELTEVIERCRKVILISKVTFAAGAVWLLTLTTGIIRRGCSYDRGHRRFWIEYEYIETDGRRHQ